MVEAPRNVTHYNTPSYMRTYWARSVDATLLILGAKYST